jgi:NAD(P)-dependent dehydrogenase (short-subunit alcohol dehydrogenase family)
MGVIDERVAIITGCGRGIGASICRLSAREGAGLVINDLGGNSDGTGSDEGPAKQLADEIIAPDGRAVSHGGDIG